MVRVNEYPTVFSCCINSPFTLFASLPLSLSLSPSVSLPLRTFLFDLISLFRALFYFPSHSSPSLSLSMLSSASHSASSSLSHTHTCIRFRRPFSSSFATVCAEPPPLSHHRCWSSLSHSATLSLSVSMFTVALSLLSPALTNIRDRSTQCAQCFLFPSPSSLFFSQ